MNSVFKACFKDIQSRINSKWNLTSTTTIEDTVWIEKKLFRLQISSPDPNSFSRPRDNWWVSCNRLQRMFQWRLWASETQYLTVLNNTTRCASHQTNTNYWQKGRFIINSFSSGISSRKSIIKNIFLKHLTWLFILKTLTNIWRKRRMKIILHNLS